MSVFQELFTHATYVGAAGNLHNYSAKLGLFLETLD